MPPFFTLHTASKVCLSIDDSSVRRWRQDAKWRIIPRSTVTREGNKMRLQNKVALLTGAAAAIKGELMGFGGAAAHLFVREGAKVVLTDIRDDLGERAAASLRAEGHDARYLPLEVTWGQNRAQVVGAVMAAHGRLDIQFNNAGVGFSTRVEDITVDIWDPRARRACQETFVDRCPSQLRYHA